MGKFTAAVEDHLVLEARVRLPPGDERMLASLGRPVPRPVSIRLLIDTGARRTTLIPGIVRHLNPRPRGEARIVTPLASIEASLHWVCLEFPGTRLPAFPELLVARLPMPHRLAQFHGLLGRDLLRQFASFEYEGQRGCYTLRDSSGLFGWLRRLL